MSSLFVMAEKKSIVLQQKKPKARVCFDQLNPNAITFVVVVNFIGSKLELEENMFSVGFQLKNL